MLGEMTSTEFSDWLALYELEPFGEVRADMRTGIVAHTIAEVNRDRKKRSRAYEVKDFMPISMFKLPAGRRPKQHWKEMLQYAVTYTKAVGGKDLRHGH